MCDWFLYFYTPRFGKSVVKSLDDLLQGEVWWKRSRTAMHQQRSSRNLLGEHGPHWPAEPILCLARLDLYVTFYINETWIFTVNRHIAPWFLFKAWCFEQKIGIKAFLTASASHWKVGASEIYSKSTRLLPVNVCYHLRSGFLTKAIWAQNCQLLRINSLHIYGQTCYWSSQNVNYQ